MLRHRLFDELGGHRVEMQDGALDECKCGVADVIFRHGVGQGDHERGGLAVGELPAAAGDLCLAVNGCAALESFHGVDERFETLRVLGFEVSGGAVRRLVVFSEGDHVDGAYLVTTYSFQNIS